MNRWMTLGVATVMLLAGVGNAQAWDLFRSENKDVKRGNELLEGGKSEEATAAYESAQRTLPNDPGVQLNKGLGLLGAGKLPEAREAFRAATQGGSPELRGKANYNLGLTFLREADALAKEEKLEESQKLLTESIDAFKNSLRNAPKNHDAAWNLELAKRRLVDLQQKKEQQDQQKKEQQDQQKDDQEKQDSQDQNQQDQNKQDPDQNKQDPNQQNQDPQKDKQNEPDQAKDPSDQQNQNKDQQPKPEQQDNKGSEPKSPEPQQGQDEAQPPPQERNPKDLPEHMQRALDALSESDDNLQKHRARARARQRPQRIEKDW